MNKAISVFIDRFGYFGFIRVLFYPLTTLITTPVRLMQTFWNCRILAKGKWSDYHHFTPGSGLEYLIYCSCALNIHRYGRRNSCPYIGLGNYPLSRWWHYSLASLYAYWRFSVIVLPLSMIAWLLAHLVWANQVDLYWVMLVIFLAFISTTFYANTFALQNYNVVAWIFFPLGLYGIFTENWILASAAWFCASFGGYTIVLLGGMLSVVYGIINWDPAPFLAMIPATLKLLTHLHLISGKIKEYLLCMGKSLGLYKNNVKYVKIVPTPKGQVSKAYFFLIYTQFLVVSFLTTGNISVMFFAGLIIFIANSTYLRFADIQSMQMLMFSLATVIVIQNPDLRLLLSYWILISPLPLLIPFPFRKDILDVVPQAAPFSIKRLNEGMDGFLTPVKSGEKVFMVFDKTRKTQGYYSGYRALVGVFLYAATRKKIHAIPDPWALWALNYQAAPDLLGRDIESVLKNIEQWKADYILVYQESGTKLDTIWEANSFKVLNKFSWTDYDTDLKGVRPYYGETPDWWLLKKP